MSTDFFIDLPDRRLRARRIEPARPPQDGFDRPALVFLHEGLGCIEMWRDFPQALCDRVGWRGLVYDRTGYGRSSPWPSPPGERYMEIEADTVLPQVLEQAGLDDVVLVGHSDGGTIALNYAANDPEPLRALVTMAAHAINEPVGLKSIAAAREAFETGDLRPRLAKYHDDVDATFYLWANAWLAPGSEPMEADARLPRIEAPLLALQGEDDEYGTELQLGVIAGKVSGFAATRMLPDCGHSPHLQARDATLAEIVSFIAPLIG